MLLAEMPSPVLQDIVAQLTLYRPDMKIVGRNVKRSKLKSQVERSQADVVILGLHTSELPKICTDLLDHFSLSLVVGIAADGRRASITVNNAGPHELLNTIQAAKG